MKKRIGMLGTAAILALAGIEVHAAAYTVTASSLNVRSGPGTTYSIVGTLSLGTRVNVVASSGDWRKIDSPKVGWCSAAYLKAVTTSSNVIPTATTDFVWSATGQIWGIWSSIRSGGRQHQAIDICNSAYPPIYSARQGTISTMAYGTGYGYNVRIGHSSGYSTVYAHMLNFYGAKRNVVRGEKIGTMGKSGAANNVVHLHWEIWRYGVKVYCPASNGQNTRAGGAINYNFSGL